MIVSNARKFIYLRVPRTGSTSLSNFLIEHLEFSREADFHTPVPWNRVPGLNMSAANRVHANLDDILGYGILRHPLEEYLVYGIVRDPVDRFLSCAWDACHEHRVAARDNNEAVIYAWQTASPNSPTFQPQAKWLLHKGKPINRIFAYERLDGLAQEILQSQQAHVTFRHRSESRRFRASGLDEALREKILNLYRDDQAIYEWVVANGK